MRRLSPFARSVRLDPRYIDMQRAAMGCATVLKNKDALPCSENHPAFLNGDDF